MSMTIDEIVKEILSKLGQGRSVRIMLSGPCGAGKTSVAKQIASAAKSIHHIEHDKLKESKDGSPSPCSLKHLDLQECFSGLIANPSSEFVIDIGGDSIFRNGVDNEDRLSQVISFKKKHNIQVVLLNADDKDLKKRFLSTKDRDQSEFKEVWKNWKISKHYWRKCSNHCIETSS